MPRHTASKSVYFAVILIKSRLVAPAVKENMADLNACFFFVLFFLYCNGYVIIQQVMVKQPLIIYLTSERETSTFSLGCVSMTNTQTLAAHLRSSSGLLKENTNTPCSKMCLWGTVSLSECTCLCPRLFATCSVTRMDPNTCTVLATWPLSRVNRWAEARSGHGKAYAFDKFPSQSFLSSLKRTEKQRKCVLALCKDKEKKSVSVCFSLSCFHYYKPTKSFKAAWMVMLLFCPWKLQDTAEVGRGEAAF